MLRGPYDWCRMPDVMPAKELADRALRRALVDIDGNMVLGPGDGAKARNIIKDHGWGDASQYRNDVPGRLRTFARVAGELGW